MTPGRIAAVRRELEAEGWTVIRTKSYRQAQERQRVAEVLRASEEKHAEHTRAWAQRAFGEQRRLADRCTYLYGLAAAHGATPDELHVFFAKEVPS